MIHYFAAANAAKDDDDDDDDLTQRSGGTSRFRRSTSGSGSKIVYVYVNEWMNLKISIQWVFSVGFILKQMDWLKDLQGDAYRVSKPYYLR